MAAKKNAPTESMKFIIGLLMINAVLDLGFSFITLIDGGSDANAIAAKVSIIRFTHSIWVTVSGDLIPGMKAPTSTIRHAATFTVIWNSMNRWIFWYNERPHITARVILEKELSKVYPEIDLVTTPDGALVGMVHCNNCTSEMNAWVSVFDEFAQSIGASVDKNTLFTTLYNKALEGDADCGGLLSYNYTSGEPVTGFDEGAPLFVRKAEDKFTLANFMRMHLYSSLAALKAGLDLMFKEEDVKVDRMFGHGGLFKTKGVGQRIAAAAMNTSVSVMETAGEGGAWGIALLAAFMKDAGEGVTLQQYLDEKIFAGQSGTSMEPDASDVAGFDAFMKRYMAGLAIEHAAVDVLK